MQSYFRKIIVIGMAAASYALTRIVVAQKTDADEADAGIGHGTVLGYHKFNTEHVSALFSPTIRSENSTLEKESLLQYQALDNDQVKTKTYPTESTVVSLRSEYIPRFTHSFALNCTVNSSGDYFPDSICTIQHLVAGNSHIYLAWTSPTSKKFVIASAEAAHAQTFPIVLDFIESEKAIQKSYNSTSLTLCQDAPYLFFSTIDSSGERSDIQVIDVSDPRAMQLHSRFTFHRPIAAMACANHYLSVSSAKIQDQSGLEIRMISADFMHLTALSVTQIPNGDYPYKKFVVVNHDEKNRYLLRVYGKNEDRLAISDHNGGYLSDYQPDDANPQAMPWRIVEIATDAVYHRAYVMSINKVCKKEKGIETCKDNLILDVISLPHAARLQRITVLRAKQHEGLSFAVIGSNLLIISHKLLYSYSIHERGITKVAELPFSEEILQSQLIPFRDLILILAKDSWGEIDRVAVVAPDIQVMKFHIGPSRGSNKIVFNYANLPIRMPIIPGIVEPKDALLFVVKNEACHFELTTKAGDETDLFTLEQWLNEQVSYVSDVEDEEVTSSFARINVVAPRHAVITVEARKEHLSPPLYLRYSMSIVTGVLLGALGIFCSRSRKDFFIVKDEDLRKLDDAIKNVEANGQCPISQRSAVQPVDCCEKNGHFMSREEYEKYIASKTPDEDKKGNEKKDIPCPIGCGESTIRYAGDLPINKKLQGLIAQTNLVRMRFNPIKNSSSTHSAAAVTASQAGQRVATRRRWPFPFGR